MSRPLLTKLVESLVLPLLDFCNSVLAGVPRRLSDKFQSVLNASAGLIRSCLLYTSPSPRDLSTSRMPSSA